MNIKRFLKKTTAFLAAALMAVSMAGCGSKDGESKKEDDPALEQYKSYVTSIMDANYHGAYDTYISLTGATQDQAVLIYEANVQDLAIRMENVLSMKAGRISVAVTEEMIELAKTIYGQAKYTAVTAMQEDDGNYTVTVEIQPIDFFGSLGGAYESAVTEFNKKSENGEFDGLTDLEYEEMYAQTVYASISGSVGQMTYSETIQVDITLEKDGSAYVLSDEDMEALDGKVVNTSR